MILLTNRVHPYGKGDVVELRRRISAAVGHALRLARRAAGRRAGRQSAVAAPAADAPARAEGPR